MFANKKLTLSCPQCGNGVFRPIANPRNHEAESSEVCSRCALVVSQLLYRARKRLRGMLKDLRTEH